MPPSSIYRDPKRWYNINGWEGVATFYYPNSDILLPRNTQAPKMRHLKGYTLYSGNLYILPCLQGQPREEKGLDGSGADDPNETHTSTRAGRNPAGRTRTMILYEIAESIQDGTDPKNVYLSYPQQNSEHQLTLAVALEDPEGYEMIKSNKIKRIYFNGGNIWIEMKRKNGKAVKGFAYADDFLTIRRLVKKLDLSENTADDPEKMAVYNMRGELLQIYDLDTFARVLTAEDPLEHIGAPSFCFMGEHIITGIWTDKLWNAMPCLCVQIDANLIIPDDLY